MPGRSGLAKRHVLPRASDTEVGLLYPSESGTRGRVLGPAYFAAASLGIGVPIVNVGVLIAALFSPGLWTSVLLVMQLVFGLNLANILLFLGGRGAGVRSPSGLRL